MSMLNASGPAGEIGETVATVTEYEAAQKLVSQLIAGEIPARAIAIVGVGVQTVERVTGRLGYANAARSGAVNGVLIGLFLSAIFVLGNPAVPMQAFVGILFVGVAIGMILSLVTYSIVRRRRDYASVMQLKADHYEVTVLAASVGKARQVLGRSVTPTPRPAPSAVAEPPQYGERVDEPPRYGERVIPERPPLPPMPPAAPAPVEGTAPEAAPADGEHPAEGERSDGDGSSR
ncbi:general stress protein [Microbacterium azadirachtae]|nr:general stress protein [Microbacterium azadirachtae]